MISVIMPIDNRKEFLQEAIESLLDQTFKDFEVIFVMDGSEVQEDDIHKHACGSGFVYKCIRTNNLGPGAARNAGLKHASRKYVTFCDSDDLLTYNALRVLYEKIEKSRADVVVGSFIEQFDSGNSVLCSISNKGTGFERFFSYISIWNRIYRREFLERNTICFINGFQAEDLLFLADIYLCSPKVAYTKAIVYQWQRHEYAKYKSLTHSDSYNGFIELVQNWNLFIDKMLPGFSQDVLSYARDACPYLLVRLNNVKDTSKREQAYAELMKLVKRMKWEAFPVRCYKLFGRKGL